MHIRSLILSFKCLDPLAGIEIVSRTTYGIGIFLQCSVVFDDARALNYLVVSDGRSFAG